MKFNFFKKISVRTYRNTDRLMNPNLVWRLILCATVVFLVIIVAWSGHVFLKVERGDFVPSEHTSPRVSQSESTGALKTILDFYEKKKEIFNNLKAHPKEFIDPSF